MKDRSHPLLMSDMVSRGLHSFKRKGDPIQNSFNVNKPTYDFFSLLHRQGAQSYLYKISPCKPSFGCSFIHCYHFFQQFLSKCVLSDFIHLLIKKHFGKPILFFVFVFETSPSFRFFVNIDNGNNSPSTSKGKSYH